MEKKGARLKCSCDWRGERRGPLVRRVVVGKSEGPAISVVTTTRSQRSMNDVRQSERKNANRIINEHRNHQEPDCLADLREVQDANAD